MHSLPSNGWRAFAHGLWFELVSLELALRPLQDQPVSGATDEPSAAADAFVPETLSPRMRAPAAIPGEWLKAYA